MSDNLPHVALCMLNQPRSVGTAIVRASAPSTKIAIAHEAGKETRLDAIYMITALHLVQSGN